MCEVHPTVRVDVGAGVVGEFSTNYLNPSWRRVPMFGINSINGGVQWLGVPNFLRTYGPAWTANLLATHPSWGDQGSINNYNWGSQSRGNSDSFSILWNRPTRVYPVYHHRIFENTHAAAPRVRDNILQYNCLARMQIPTTCLSPIHNPLGHRDDNRDDLWDEPVY